MPFGKAYEAMKAGHKVRHKDFKHGGYWCWEDNTIMIHCGDGTVLDIRQTPFVDYTFSFIASDAWSIID
jgi:hypothetical protein